MELAPQIRMPLTAYPTWLVTISFLDTRPSLSMHITPDPNRTRQPQWTLLESCKEELIGMLGAYIAADPQVSRVVAHELEEDAPVVEWSRSAAGTVTFYPR